MGTMRRIEESFIADVGDYAMEKVLTNVKGTMFSMNRVIQVILQCKKE